jgi:hypothetical protein
VIHGRLSSGCRHDMMRHHGLAFSHKAVLSRSKVVSLQILHLTDRSIRPNSIAALPRKSVLVQTADNATTL